MEDSIFVYGANYFKQECLDNMIKLLDDGNTIHVGIDCIGHTRNNMVQEEYKDALQKHYGDRLVIIFNDGYCSYSYGYKLK